MAPAKPAVPVKTPREPIISAALAGLALAATALAQPEQWLQYHTSPDGRASRWLDLTTNAPPGVALPKLGAQPYFARWQTPLDPSGGRWLCFDRSRRSGPYDRVYFDSTGNGRLDDKTPVSAPRVDSSVTMFNSLRFVFKGEDGPITYHLTAAFYNLSGDDRRLLARSAGWYEGTVDMGGKKRHVQLVDNNVNGVFNDQGKDPSNCDAITVEGDRLGDHYLGKLLELDNQFYRVEIARDGAFLKVSKVDNVVTGQVRVPENVASFIAVGEPGHFIRKPAKGTFTLPVGNYRINGWTVNRRDRGAEWTLTGYSFPEAANFEVTAGQPVSLEIGEPVRTVMETREQSGEVTFNLSLIGQRGELIQMLRGGERPKGPRLTLASTAGSYHYTNNFEFG